MASMRRSITPRERVPRGERRVVVRSYMAHHQGMSLVALANTLLADVMPRRFHAEPMVRAIDLLLQERIPAIRPSSRPPTAKGPAGLAAADGADDTRRPDEPALDFARHARPAHELVFQLVSITS